METCRQQPLPRADDDGEARSRLRRRLLGRRQRAGPRPPVASRRLNAIEGSVGALPSVHLVTTCGASARLAHGSLKIPLSFFVTLLVAFALAASAVAFAAFAPTSLTAPASPAAMAESTLAPLRSWAASALVSMG